MTELQREIWDSVSVPHQKTQPDSTPLPSQSALENQDHRRSIRPALVHF